MFKFTRRPEFVAFVVVFLLALTLLTFCAPRADAASYRDPVINTDPDLYVARLAPIGAHKIDVTLSNGHRAVINPCRFEDGRRCYWKASERGDGVGRSFVVLAGRVFFTNLRGL